MQFSRNITADLISLGLLIASAKIWTRLYGFIAREIQVRYFLWKTEQTGLLSLRAAANFGFWWRTRGHDIATANRERYLAAHPQREPNPFTDIVGVDAHYIQLARMDAVRLVMDAAEYCTLQKLETRIPFYFRPFVGRIVKKEFTELTMQLKEQRLKVPDYGFDATFLETAFLGPGNRPEFFEHVFRNRGVS